MNYTFESVRREDVTFLWTKSLLCNHGRSIKKAASMRGRRDSLYEKKKVRRQESVAASLLRLRFKCSSCFFPH